LYEKQLIERTHDACKGLVDIVIDFGTTSRSLHRSLQCLSEGGVVLISDEVAEKLLPKFSRKAEERKQHIEPVPTGTIEQLQDLVKLVANKEVSRCEKLSSGSFSNAVLARFRFSHHLTQSSPAKRPRKSSASSSTRRFPDAPFSNSTTLNKKY
jgi:D-arabinose 1-dehydrogenase-like Zn-dependent alcohol dehydrogenase